MLFARLLKGTVDYRHAMASCVGFKALVAVLSEILLFIKSCAKVAEYLLAVRSVYKVTYVVVVMELCVISALCGKAVLRRVLNIPLCAGCVEFKVVVIVAAVVLFLLCAAVDPKTLRPMK